MARFAPRGSRLRSHPFYTTIILLSLLTAGSFFFQTTSASSYKSFPASQHGALFDRSSTPHCTEVHGADNKCAFVREYCADDAAGLINYLELYYCELDNAQPLAFVALVLWLGLLFTTIGIAASDFFSVNLSTISIVLRLSESLAGVTFLALGNGSPDVFSTFAAMSSNSASMAVGELIGAASFIAGVVAGSMALVREFRVDRKTYSRDICFFIVAVALTTFFLADGHLRFWECWLMIGYYVVYVLTVVGWHCMSTRRKSRKRKEGEARSHVYGHSGGDDLAGEPYRDDPDEVPDGGESGEGHEGGERGEGSSSASSLFIDVPDIEAAPIIKVHGADGVSGSPEASVNEHQRMVVAEVASSMRVLRGRPRRSTTLIPIRPSLVGALEFRSALAQLQRESNLPLATIQDRGYSDHPDHHPKQRRGTTSVVTDSARSDGHFVHQRQPSAPVVRERALSSGDSPVGAEHHPDLLIPGLIPERQRADTNLSLPHSATSGERTRSPSPSYTLGGNLAPPPVGQTGAIDSHQEADQDAQQSSAPLLRLEIPSRRSTQSDRSPPGTPFPLFTDSPGILTPNPAVESSEFMSPLQQPARESPFADLQLPADPPTPVKWWPYSMLPPPHVLLATLFPTLQGWKDKTYWDKFVSAISVPSLFLLVTTLPVVESAAACDDISPVDAAVDLLNRSAVTAASGEPAPLEPETEWQRYRRLTLGRILSPAISPGASPSLNPVHPGPSSPLDQPVLWAPDVVTRPASEIPSAGTEKQENTGWNRWLVALQLFTGPQFASLVLWANTADDLERPGRVLLFMVLWSLVVSLVLLAGLLTRTTAERPPKYHFVLCFMGFAISVAWISTIAGEVVGVLKTFGVILNISEALLGLTIFAAGNSVGDLVANITIARLGYPVMALSACFGGPMLNILMGIGLGGVGMMIKSANYNHRRHPEQPMQYGPYDVQIGGSLMVSAITLLVTLAGLLIVVPMNKWMLRRKIGYGLIGLWAVTTTANVIMELSGVWGHLE